jgi:hypothetical protein
MAGQACVTSRSLAPDRPRTTQVEALPGSRVGLRMQPQDERLTRKPSPTADGSYRGCRLEGLSGLRWRPTSAAHLGLQILNRVTSALDIQEVIRIWMSARPRYVNSVAGFGEQVGETVGHRGRPYVGCTLSVGFRCLSPRVCAATYRAPPRSSIHCGPDDLPTPRPGGTAYDRVVHAMNWADMMRENAAPASRKLLTTHPTVLPREAPISWEPHEVWLTRIKEPRNDAAMLRAQARTASPDEYKLF